MVGGGCCLFLSTGALIRVEYGDRLRLALVSEEERYLPSLTLRTGQSPFSASVGVWVI